MQTDHEEFRLSMYDRRKVHTPFVKNVDTGKLKPYDPPPRAWSQTRGITLHQTACSMGERLERYDHIGSHFVVLRSGRVLWMADLNSIVYHGNGWNNQCVGIEIDGLYAGLKGVASTVWNDPTTPFREVAQTPTVEALESTRQLVRWIVAEVDRKGGKVAVLGAHRQSSLDRENDPGEEIWKEVALPLHAELGLTDGGIGFKIGGFPIPEMWDPKAKGIKY